MSNFINDNLLERASLAIDFWVNTPLAAMIEKAIEDNDLFRVHELLIESEKEIDKLDFINEPMTDERADAMWIERSGHVF